MTIKINAAARLRLVKANWFDELSVDMQEEYRKEHPDSKYAKNPQRTSNNTDFDLGDDDDDEVEYKSDQADKELKSPHFTKQTAIQETKDAINSLIDEIKSIEGTGDDASDERSELLTYRRKLAEQQAK